MVRTWRSQIADEVRATSMMKPKWEPRDWPEDLEHENGNYNCICGECGEVFVGHKRRVRCKICSINTVERKTAWVAYGNGPLLHHQGMRERFDEIANQEGVTMEDRAVIWGEMVEQSDD